MREDEQARGDAQVLEEVAPGDEQLAQLAPQAPGRQSSTEWKAKASRLITASRLARPSEPWPKLCLLFRYRNNEEYFLVGGAADGGRQ